MPPKKFLKSKDKSTGRGKKAPQEPETANEFLAVADEFESAGSKWKAGDAQKALRFYARAFDVYNAGLKRFPKDFDLAYNKAHLQYLIISDPSLKDLAIEQGEDERQLLAEALNSHRYALSLDQTNADILFNTAQVLTLSAEEINSDSEEVGGELSVKYLQDAIELLEACATRQEMEYEEQAAAREGIDSSGSAPTPATATTEGEPENSSDSEKEEWVLVTQPVTANTLLDTAVATLSAMTSLINTYIQTPPQGFQASAALATTASLASRIIDSKIPAYIKLLESSPPLEIEKEEGPVLSLSGSTAKAPPKTDPVLEAKQETVLAVAQFRAASASAEFNFRLCWATNYLDQLKTAFETPLAAINPSPACLYAYADALVDFADSSTDRSKTEPSADSANELRKLSWTALTAADDYIAKAITLATNEDKAKMYMLRGDISLQRRQLALDSSASSELRDAEKVLLKNAGVYYRGAAKLAQAQSEGGSEWQDAAVKAWVVGKLEGQAVEDIKTFEKKVLNFMDIATEMVEEGLIEDNIL